MLTRLPVDEPNLVVGPLVDREPRVLAVAHDHPLASRTAVSIEDIAGYDVGWPDALIPRSATPSSLARRRAAGRSDGCGWGSGTSAS